jgi:hypothetical protein
MVAFAAAIFFALFQHSPYGKPMIFIWRFPPTPYDFHMELFQNHMISIPYAAGIFHSY